MQQQDGQERAPPARPDLDHAALPHDLKRPEDAELQQLDSPAKLARTVPRVTRGGASTGPLPACTVAAPPLAILAAIDGKLVRTKGEAVRRSTTRIKARGAAVAVAIALLAPATALGTTTGNDRPVSAAGNGPALRQPATGHGGLGWNDAAIAAGIVAGIVLLGVWGDVVVGSLIGGIAALAGAGAALVATGRYDASGPARRSRRASTSSQAGGTALPATVHRTRRKPPFAKLSIVAMIPRWGSVAANRRAASSLSQTDSVQ
jgi:hypothetical protein